MFNPNNQEWTNTNENWSEHFETTNYLKYNLEKALYSLNNINKYEGSFLRGPR